MTDAREAILELIERVRAYPISCSELLRLANGEKHVSNFLMALPEDTEFESDEDIFERYMQSRALHEQQEDAPMELVYDEDLGAA